MKKLLITLFVLSLSGCGAGVSAEYFAKADQLCSKNGGTIYVYVSYWKVYNPNTAYCKDGARFVFDHIKNKEEK